ncbi:UNVERIFIED_CONTAM: hypothetical protein K2H54_012485 [Gekko kuhli]
MVRKSHRRAHHLELLQEQRHSSHSTPGSLQEQPPLNLKALSGSASNGRGERERGPPLMHWQGAWAPPPTSVSLSAHQPSTRVQRQCLHVCSLPVTGHVGKQPSQSRGGNIQV